MPIIKMVSAMVAVTAVWAGLLMLMQRLLSKCTDVNLMRKISRTVPAARTTMTCFAELTVMTAASPGPQMTQRSGTQTTHSADARLKRSEKSSLATAACLSTVESVVHIAANATCLGKQQTLQVLKELQLIADARDPGEAEHNLVC